MCNEGLVKRLIDLHDHDYHTNITYLVCACYIWLLFWPDVYSLMLYITNGFRKVFLGYLDIAEFCVQYMHMLYSLTLSANALAGSVAIFKIMLLIYMLIR